MKSFEIRLATPADADTIAAVHMDSIRTLGAQAYPPEVIAEWGEPRTGERYSQAMAKGELFFVAIAADTASKNLLGFSSWRVEDDKHRTAIYVSGSAAGQSVGSALFKAAEQAAKKRGATEIHVDASLAAFDFYKHMGFVELERGQHRLRNGYLMDCVFMKKTL